MSKNKQQHVEYQRSYFDHNCDFFKQPIPEEIEERTRVIAQAADLNKSSRVLDVGTGMGALIKHFLEMGVKPANILGCDLSERMLEEARRRYPEVQFWQADVVELPAGDSSFDAVFFNACFGNIFDQQGAIAVAARVLAPGGALIISHPLGNEFVQQLKDSDPQLVLTLMPDETQLHKWCDKHALTLVSLRDEPSFYLAKLQKH